MLDDRIVPLLVDVYLCSIFGMLLFFGEMLLFFGIILLYYCCEVREIRLQ